MPEVVHKLFDRTQEISNAMFSLIKRILHLNRSWFGFWFSFSLFPYYFPLNRTNNWNSEEWNGKWNTFKVLWQLSIAKLFDHSIMNFIGIIPMSINCLDFHQNVKSKSCYFTELKPQTTLIVFRKNTDVSVFEVYPFQLIFTLANVTRIWFCLFIK